MESQLRTFMYQLAQSLGKKPTDFEPFIKTLEDNWIENTEQLSTLTESQWSELKFPMGLVNAIKKNLQPQQPPPQQIDIAQTQFSQQQQYQQQKSTLSDEPMTIIDTSSSNNQQQQSAFQNNEDFIEEQCLICLNSLKDDELANNKTQHHQTVETLFKIIQNLIAKPLDPEVRRLKKSNKAVQTRILQFRNAVEFLKIISFNFDDQEFIELKPYKKETLEAGLNALNRHIQSLGAVVDNPIKFDPYKAQISSTTGNAKLPPGSSDVIDKYDPTKVGDQIEKLRKQKEYELQKNGRVQERNITVYNTQHSGANLKNFLMDLDQKEQERLKALKLTEEKMDEQIENTTALKFMAENQQNQKFKNKRQEELDKMVKKQVQPTALVRIKFPDDYCIQGTFGALERVEDVYKFVSDNLFDKAREFYLYTAPPKKPLNDMKIQLNKAKMVPSGNVFFAWTDLDQTLHTDGPFLDIASLKDKIIAF